MEITVQWFLSPWLFTSLSTCAHFSTQPSFPSFILLLSFGNVYSQMDHFKCNFTKVCNSFLLSLTQNPIFSPWHMKSCRIKFSPPLLRHLKPFSCSPQRRFLLLLCMCLVAQSCPTLCYPMDCRPPGSFVHGDYCPGKNTGVGWHDFLQGTFPRQGLKPGLPHCR